MARCSGQSEASVRSSAQGLVKSGLVVQRNLGHNYKSFGRFKKIEPEKKNSHHDRFLLIQESPTVGRAPRV